MQSHAVTAAEYHLQDDDPREIADGEVAASTVRAFDSCAECGILDTVARLSN